MSTTATLYFTKFSDGNKQVLTELGWKNANDLERLRSHPIACYQVRDFTIMEFERIMNMPFDDVLNKYFPNI